MALAAKVRRVPVRRAVDLEDVVGGEAVVRGAGAVQGAGDDGVVVGAMGTVTAVAVEGVGIGVGERPRGGATGGGAGRLVSETAHPRPERQAAERDDVAGEGMVNADVDVVTAGAECGADAVRPCAAARAGGIVLVGLEKKVALPSGLEGRGVVSGIYGAVIAENMVAALADDRPGGGRRRRWSAR